MPRKAKSVTDVRSLARADTEGCIRTLRSIRAQPKAPPAARIAAAQALLDRGWGKAAQIVSGPDGGPIEHKVTVIGLD